MDLQAYDVILVNSSAGKDSQAMLDYVVELARAQGVVDRVVVVHCDLGRVEWQGTRELAERQAAHYGVRFEVVSRGQGDLLQQVAERGMWPSNTARYCTSDQKRGPVRTLMTRLVREFRSAKNTRRACRILNCMGLRGDESPARRQCPTCRGKEERPRGAGQKWVPVSTCTRCGKTGDRPVLERDEAASNGRRSVDTWLPVHDWSVAQVWARIKASGVEHHRAYDLGMTRLSCCFCIFAPENALMIAGEHNRELLDAYVAVEQKIGHTFRKSLPIVQVRDALDRGERGDVAADDGGCWGM